MPTRDLSGRVPSGSGRCGARTSVAAQRSTIGVPAVASAKPARGERERALKAFIGTSRCRQRLSRCWPGPSAFAAGSLSLQDDEIASLSGAFS
jgi:hypothetical protein